MLQAPTGFGKTLMAAHIIRRALDKGKRVAFTVPARLIDQTVEAFEAEGIHALGVMQGIHPRTDRGAPVQVCSVQTLARRKRPDVDLILVDEAHQLHKEIFRWMADCREVPFVGLSATPWAWGLGKHYDDLIVAARTADLIRDGYLAYFTVFAPSEPDLAGVRIVAGDFHEGELAERCNTDKLVGDVIERSLARGENRSTLVYGVNRAHAEHLHQRFVESGIPASYIDAFIDRPEREHVFDRFRGGEVRVICNVATLAIGIGLPTVSCIIDARPTKSEMLFVQTIGRGLRTAPGKDKLVVLDHAGNHLRLGMVTDINHETLDDGEGARRSAAEQGARAALLPLLCDECKAVMSRQAKACTACGAIREAKSHVLHADGELIELGSRAASAWVPTIAEKAAFYGELKGYARSRHYAPGWAGHTYRKRFGVWPNDPRVRFAAPTTPSLRTKQWVLSRQIAFVKAMAAHG